MINLRLAILYLIAAIVCVVIHFYNRMHRRLDFQSEQIDELEDSIFDLKYPNRKENGNA